MNINYRQGIISGLSVSSVPAFLRRNSSTGFIDLLASDINVVITFAHGVSDYIVKLHGDKLNYWGPINSGANQYLYWDVSLVDGLVTGGVTSFAPVYATSAPSSPSLDQHWFDLTVNLMKVWNGSFWVEKVRLFAALVTGGSVITMQPFATQIGSSGNVMVDAGFIMYDQAMKPIRLSSGHFFTTNYQSFVDYSPAYSTVKLDQNVMVLQATEAIPAYSLVCISAADKMGLANVGDSTKVAIGVAETSTSSGAVSCVTFRGLISNADWSSVTDAAIVQFTTQQIGKPLYLGALGQFSFTGGAGSQKVGTVVNTSSIYLNIVSSQGDTGATGTPGVQLTTVNRFVKNQSTAPTALTYGATLATDASLSNSFKVTLTGNSTLLNPSNLTEGMIIYFLLIQDATGSRTIFFDSLFTFADNVVPSLSTTGLSRDLLTCYYDGAHLLCSMGHLYTPIVPAFDTIFDFSTSANSGMISIVSTF